MYVYRALSIFCHSIATSLVCCFALTNKKQPPPVWCAVGSQSAISRIFGRQNIKFELDMQEQNAWQNMVFIAESLNSHKILHNIIPDYKTKQMENGKV